MSASSTGLPPERPRLGPRAPHLPAGFNDTFTSRYIDTGGCASTRSSEVTGRRCCLVYVWPKRAVG